MGQRHDAACEARRALALIGSAATPGQRASMEEVVAAAAGSGGGSGDASGASKKTCAHCGLAPPKRVGCTRCRAAWYCDKHCQLAAYPAHRKPCKRAAKAAKKKGGGAAGGAGGGAAASAAMS